MTILVVGRSGQLAQGLKEAADEKGVSLAAVGRPDIDLTDRASIVSAILSYRPQIVINATAYTAVDKAESEPEAAEAVNAFGAETIAATCATARIPVIHISTDYVFDGAKAALYTEDDPTGPINSYGRSKLDGERRVAAACPQHLIFRTAWLHSPWGTNFVRTMLRLAQSRPSIDVVSDQIGSPTYAPHLAEAILSAARRALDDPAGMPWGIYHAAGAGETSWAGFAKEIFRRASEQGLPGCQVTPISATDYPTPARRPANSRLNADKLQQRLGLSLPDWTIGVKDCISRLAAAPR